MLLTITINKLLTYYIMISEKKIYYILHLFFNILIIYFLNILELKKIILFIIALYVLSILFTKIDFMHHILSIIFLFYLLIITYIINNNYIIIIKLYIYIATGFPGCILYISLIFNFYSNKLYFIYAFYLRFIPIFCISIYLFIIFFLNNDIYGIIFGTPIMLFIISNAIYYSYDSYKKILDN